MVDALLEAEQTLRLMDKIHSPAEFIHLNDSILDTVSLGNVRVRSMLLDTLIDTDAGVLSMLLDSVGAATAGCCPCRGWAHALRAPARQHPALRPYRTPPGS